jgi:hypothetical protein
MLSDWMAAHEAVALVAKMLPGAVKSVAPTKPQPAMVEGDLLELSQQRAHEWGAAEQQRRDEDAALVTVHAWLTELVRDGTVPHQATYCGIVGRRAEHLWSEVQLYLRRQPINWRKGVVGFDYRDLELRRSALIKAIKEKLSKLQPTATVEPTAVEPEPEQAPAIEAKPKPENRGRKKGSGGERAFAVEAIRKSRDLDELRKAAKNIAARKTGRKGGEAAAQEEINLTRRIVYQAKVLLKTGDEKFSA